MEHSLEFVIVFESLSSMRVKAALIVILDSFFYLCLS